MRKEEFYLPSCDEQTNLHYIIWYPDTEKPKAVLQIIHGMCEHINRYDDFARYLNSKGIAVIGHDILGHGHSVSSIQNLGFFSSKHGNKYNITDIHNIHNLCLELFPDTYYFILGHSMGSFLLRQYLHSYRNSYLHGAIIMGTGHEPGEFIKLAGLFANSLCKIQGKKYRSKILYQMTLGNKNKAFFNEKTKTSWLTADKKEQLKYEQDPLCKFKFTVSAYKDLFIGINSLYFPKNLARMNKNLPILLTSGTMDPVGKYGVNVEKVYSSYKAHSFKDVSLKLWRGMRHEILHEVNKEAVYSYLYTWMNNYIEKG